MGLGSYSYIKLTGKKKDLEKIFELADNANDGEFYENVFHISTDEMTDEQINDFLDQVGVNSLTQANCSAKWIDEINHMILQLNVYSTYETPLGLWEKLTSDFPKVTGVGDVIREEDENVQGSIYFCNGIVNYQEPEYVGEDEEDDYEDEDEDE